MFNAAKSVAVLAEFLASVSTKLSVALVLGLAALPVIPHDHTATARVSAPAASAPIEVVRTKSVPVIEVARSEPLPVAALPTPRAPPLAPEVETRSDTASDVVTEAMSTDSAPIVVAARRRSRTREDVPPEKLGPVRKNSAIATDSDALTEAAPAGRTPTVVAARRRSRTREELPPERLGPVRKNSAIAMEEKPKAAPIPPPEPKPESAAEAELPKPDVWTEAEIIAGLRECVRLLAPIAADVEVSQPVKHEQCGTPAPVMLRRIGSGATKVEISPPALLNCGMVASLHTWVEKTLQPAAQEALGTPIVRLRSASGYSCRNRNGSAFNSDKLSEHAKANAIDIAAFVTADGRTIEVARFWGPTARDQREAERIAAEQAEGARKESAKKESAKPEPAKADPGPNRKPSVIATGASAPERDRKGKASPVQTSELQKLGRGAREAPSDAKAVPAPLAAEREAARQSAEGAFLRRLHKGACGTFGTVLGPEANEAHRDHFHFDLAARRRNAYCE
jgi:hypothetical protein